MSAEKSRVVSDLEAIVVDVSKALAGAGVKVENDKLADAVKLVLAELAAAQDQNRKLWAVIKTVR